MSKKRRNRENKRDGSAEPYVESVEEASGEQMLGHHRDEFAEDRQPAFYHFSREELQHKEDLIDRVAGAK